MKAQSSFWPVMLAAAALLLPVITAAQPQQTRSTPTGNAESGRELFSTYKCYACHGYGGETGSPRLVPMRLDEAAFLTFVSLGSSSGAMPSYSDVPIEALANIYAYTRSIPPDTTSASDIPLLDGILREVEKQR